MDRGVKHHVFNYSSSLGINESMGGNAITYNMILDPYLYHKSSGRRIASALASQDTKYRKTFIKMLRCVAYLQN